MFFTPDLLNNVWKFYRVKDWIKNLGIVVIGLVLAGSLDIRIFLVILTHTSFLLAHSFSINDFYDFKLMKEANYISKKIKKGTSEQRILAFTLLPLFGILATSLFLPFNSLMFTLLFILFFNMYSCPPLRLKRNWFFSLFINSLCIGAFLFLISYFSAAGSLTNKAVMLVVIFFNYIFSTELIHQISHMKKDKKARIRSFPNAYGIKNSLKLFQLSQSIVVIMSLYLLYVDFYLYTIFIGTIVFSLSRILKVRGFYLKRTNFKKMRNRMYGLYEGLYYLIWLTFLKW